MRIAGCVPAYNNESTIAAAVASLKAQTIALEDIFVVDDGSTDATAKVAMEAGARVVSMGSNQGRGAARARAIEETQADLLLSVDGTNALAPDFLAKTLPWFEDNSVAAVYGRITQSSPKTSVDRWRGRHLYREDLTTSSGFRDGLITWGLAMRTNLVKKCGNFNSTYRHSEDGEFGARLISNGYRIVEEREAIAETQVSNTALACFERHARWNGLLELDVPNSHRVKTGLFLVRQDIREGQIARAWVSIRYLAYLIRHPSSNAGMLGAVS